MRTAIYVLGSSILGIATIAGYLLALALYIGVFITLITGVWGGFIWGIIWLVPGFAISLLAASLLALPFTGMGALLMYLGGNPKKAIGNHSLDSYR